MQARVKFEMNSPAVPFSPRPGISPPILQLYIVTERVALNIVTYRDEHGRFRSRKQLNNIPGIGAKTYEQAAGFLRIRDGENPLDGTAVHPESYPMVEQIGRSLGTPVSELIANPQLLTKVDTRQIDTGAFTVKDILEELRKPGRDPREQFILIAIG
jgi:uncharacterized protein